MAVYNLTNITGSNDFLQYTQALNNLTDGLFGIMLYLTIVTIIFLTLRFRTTADDATVFAVSGWMGLLFSGLLFVTGLIPAWVASLSLVLAVFSFGLMYFKGNN